MSAPPDRDRLGTVLATTWALLHLLALGALGSLAMHERPAVADHMATLADSVPDSEPASA
ncbi:hypothetical protein GCM10009544_50910 [Streptomyces stramineus]|uniref:Uncharacterized protein n=1 Tax=Streptomyces stramineus TaxID=173861 RepID=A0ABP3KMI8_9ACTN